MGGGPHRICSRISHRLPEDGLAVTVVSWNIAKKHEPWRQLLQMDADVALLQEASLPPDDVMRLRDATLPPPQRAPSPWTSAREKRGTPIRGTPTGGAGAGAHCMTAGRWWCASQTGSTSSGSSRWAR